MPGGVANAITASAVDCEAIEMTGGEVRAGHRPSLREGGEGGLSSRLEESIFKGRWRTHVFAHQLWRVLASSLLEIIRISDRH